MADIRINALATTAASTASDDFVAVDGSANGTRKLNAYSPTFGGNLTVSGTASVTGQINGSAGYQFRGATGTTYELLRYVGGTNNPGIFATVNESTKKVTIFASGSLVSGQTLGLGAEGSEALTLGAANATLAGNLTVSGGTITGGTSGMSLAAGGTNQNITLTPSGTGAVVANTTSGASIFLQRAGTLIGSVVVAGVNEFALSAAAGKVTNLYANGYGAVALSIQANANLLIGTTTDSGNGKLQLADHTTSAGGIGFGTDTALYRYGSGILGLDHIGGSVPGLNLLANGTRIISIYGASNSLYLDTFNAAGAMYLRTGAQTTALTLDSGQNATFAGRAILDGVNSVLVVKGANPTGVASSTIVDYASGSRIISYGSTTGTAAGFSFVGLSSNGSVGGTRFSIDSAGDASFSGTIATQGGTASTPANAFATGTAGTIRWDASYIYVCTAANTWKRVAIATW